MSKLTSDEAAETAPVIRDLIKHENELVNQRLTWLIQSQALFFAALGFSWASAPTALNMLFAFLGIATSISLWSAISMYSPAVRNLATWWENNAPADYLSRPLVQGLSFPSKGIAKALRPWRALPFLFCLAWCMVVIIALCR